MPERPRLTFHHCNPLQKKRTRYVSHEVVRHSKEFAACQSHLHVVAFPQKGRSIVVLQGMREEAWGGSSTCSHQLERNGVCIRLVGIYGMLLDHKRLKYQILPENISRFIRMFTDVGRQRILSSLCLPLDSVPTHAKMDAKDRHHDVGYGRILLGVMIINNTVRSYRNLYQGLFLHIPISNIYSAARF